MYCGIQECHGQRGQLVRFSCNTDSISEMTNNNLLFLCPPRAKVSRLKEWEQKQDQFCAWAACCCRCEAFKYTLFCESLCFAVEETQSSFQQIFNVSSLLQFFPQSIWLCCLLTIQLNTAGACLLCWSGINTCGIDHLHNLNPITQRRTKEMSVDTLIVLLHVYNKMN